MVKYIANLGIKTKIIASFLFILLLPNLTIGYFSYYTLKANVEQQIINSASGNIELLNNSVNEMINNAMNGTNFLAKSIQAGTITNPNDVYVNSLLNRFKNEQPQLGDIYIGTEAGLFIHAPKLKMPKDYDARKRPWYQGAMQRKGQAVISDPYISKTTGNIVITISKVTSDGKGVVGVDLSLKALSDLVKKIQVGKKGYAFVFDAKGKVLVYPNVKAGEDGKIESGLQSMFQSESGQFQYKYNEQTKKVVFTTNLLTGWKLGGTIFLQEITDTAKPIFYKTAMMIVISILVGSLLAYMIVLSIVRLLKKLVEASEKISNGDLTVILEVKSNDELGQLGKCFNKMSESLRSMVTHVNETAEQLAASSEELTASSEQTGKASGNIAETLQEVAVGAQTQSHRLNESTQIVKKMSDAITHIAANTHNVSKSAVEASTASLKGKQEIKSVSEQMTTIYETIEQIDHMIKRLGERSKEISTIVALITGIADQTNLLSLNAAIEAARAGEHGKGFAVVADEVRKLAEQASFSSQQIADEIHTIQKEIEEAVKSMEKGTMEVAEGMNTVSIAGNSFEKIYEVVNMVTSQIEEVSASTAELSANAKQFAISMDEIDYITGTTVASVQHISAATQEQLASVEEIASSSASLSHTAEELQTLIKKFKI
ncbi:methyl-accepting chemotaxis protein [Aneurinibacillus terranovensis]|uniref:methyl-accepting chemotaxis protein n=1 Tax=Aneurinibacillus terranovensis TaxID=278991 RepID=UPI00041D62B4|nr:methyl-accepting chemotaxis protein [Aneurinibacillus terranovensis]